MDIEQIHEIARQSMVYLRPDPAREPGFVFYHGRRTAQIALKLAGQIDAQVDRDILYAGALFHDVGKGSNPHNEVGAHMVRDLLGGVCQPEELERICQIVREHNQRRQPNAYAPETRLVQDADLLDHVGPIGPWLTFYWNATHGETIDDALCFFHSEENAHLQESTRNALNLDISVRIFDQRIAFERQFFAALERAHTEGL